MSQFERMTYINDKINLNGKVTLKDIVNHFEVSKRTAIRDIEFMRNIFQAPIQYSSENKGYIYNQEFDAFNFTDEKMLLFYSFLKSITKQNLNYIPFVSQNLLNYISKNLSLSYQNLSENIFYELSMHESISIKYLHDILQSMITKKQCFISYVNSKGGKSQRYIEAYRLINYYGIWYLLAHCQKSLELRLFVVSRIISISKTNQAFQSKVESKDLDAFQKHGFGIVKGKHSKIVTIRFYQQAYYIIRNQIWHSQQKKEEGVDDKKGKYVQLSFPVASYAEILGKVLQYHINAQVISPPDFKNEWISTIKKLYNQVSE